MSPAVIAGPSDSAVGSARPGMPRSSGNGSGRTGIVAGAGDRALGAMSSMDKLSGGPSAVVDASSTLRSRNGLLSGPDCTVAGIVPTVPPGGPSIGAGIAPTEPLPSGSAESPISGV